MASLDKDEVTGRFRIRFRYGGQEFKRSLRVKEAREAEGIRGRVEETIILLERGRLTMPQDAEPATFILTDGKLDRKLTLGTSATLGGLFAVYGEKFSATAKEANTRRVERLHSRHLERVLGSRTPLRQITTASVQQYVDGRAAEKWNGKLIKAETIRKEVATLRMVWTWATRQNLVKESAPNLAARLTFPKGSQKPPFQTWDQVKAITARGGLTKEQLREVWDRVFLDSTQVNDFLAFVRTHRRRCDWLSPIFLFAAHTGARRSEMMRSLVEDFNFASGVVLIREKKKSKSTHTFRTVDLTPELSDVMQRYFRDLHPGGLYAFSKVAGEPLTERAVQHGFRTVTANTPWAMLRGFHIFRHSFASNLAAAGIDQRLIDELMGHQTEAMRKRYRHLFPDQRRAAITRVYQNNTATIPSAILSAVDTPTAISILPG